MKKKYNVPLLELVYMDCKDILTASSELNEGNWEVGEAPIFG